MIPNYIAFRLSRDIDNSVVEAADIKKEKNIDKSTIPLDKQIQAVARKLYKTYIEAGQFKYELKDKIKKMTRADMSDSDIEDAQEMGDNQLWKLEMSVDEIEQRMIAMAGDNAKLSQMAQVWAGEAKNLAAKKNQEYMEKRADKLEKEADALLKDKKEKKKSSKDDENKKNK
jgi:hypothetical protein